MFQTKIAQKIKTHFFVFNYFFFFENRAVYEIMWKNIVQPDKQQMTIRRMPIACSMTKATNTHSEYVIPTASPLARTRLNVTLYVNCLSA